VVSGGLATPEKYIRSGGADLKEGGPGLAKTDRKLRPAAKTDLVQMKPYATQVFSV